jgi:hypothetical protein
LPAVAEASIFDLPSCHVPQKLYEALDRTPRKFSRAGDRRAKCFSVVRSAPESPTAAHQPRRGGTDWNANCVDHLLRIFVNSRSVPKSTDCHAEPN